MGAVPCSAMMSTAPSIAAPAAPAAGAIEAAVDPRPPAVVAAVDAQLRALDRATLTPVVRRATGSQTIEVRDWQVASLNFIAVMSNTGGIFRITGTAVDAATAQSPQEAPRLVPWSLVLKVACSPAGGRLPGGGAPVPDGWGTTESHGFYWRREAVGSENSSRQGEGGG